MFMQASILCRYVEKGPSLAITSLNTGSTSRLYLDYRSIVTSMCTLLVRTYPETIPCMLSARGRVINGSNNPLMFAPSCFLTGVLVETCGCITQLGCWLPCARSDRTHTRIVPGHTLTG